MASLTTLPVEIQCAIFRVLDPAGLISISQTSSHLREIIQPRRKNLVERLLQLECDEKKGGITPSFDARNNVLSPGWAQPEWTAMHWACSGCLRLLSHQCFDNHSLLRLAYRKPVPGSPVADALTTWESAPKANPRLPHLRRENRTETDDYIQEKKTRRRYEIALSGRWQEPAYSLGTEQTFAELQSCGWTAFDDMTLSEYKHMDPGEKKPIFDREIRAIERTRCGYKRYLRKCLECRFQAGQLKPSLIGSDGTAKIPVAVSRQFTIPTATDRFFPRLSEHLENKRPANDPPSYAIYRRHARDRFYSMYMIRCPECEIWKEAKCFQLGTIWTGWRPARLSRRRVDELRCHHCYARKYGRGGLAMVFVREVEAALSSEISRLQYRLGHGWHCLRFEPELRKFPRALQAEIHAIANEPNALAKSKDNYENDVLTVADLALFRERYDMWMAMRARLLATGKERLIRGREKGSSSEWFYLWTHNYDVLEAFYKWLQAVQVELEEKPEKLADWALSDACQ